jgi:hypothetical protein
MFEFSSSAVQQRTTIPVIAVRILITHFWPKVVEATKRHRLGLNPYSDFPADPALRSGGCVKFGKAITRSPHAANATNSGSRIEVLQPVP